MLNILSHNNNTKIRMINDLFILKKLWLYRLTGTDFLEYAPLCSGRPDRHGITPSITILSAEIQPDCSSVVLAMSLYQESVSYTLSVANIDDTEIPPNTLTSASLTYRFVDQPITAISRSNYEMASRFVGDPVSSDRDYVYTTIPSRWTPVPSG
ncbi:MAG: hypothetical protein JW795_23645 [Chitinivibrionales bacterium]|nr:hypothetical protein [Chitinivibrionales bacterium]